MKYIHGAAGTDAYDLMARQPWNGGLRARRLFSSVFVIVRSLAVGCD